MAERSTPFRWLLSLCVSAGLAVGALGQGTSTAPISLTADEAYRWSDSSRQIIVLGGQVLIEQGTRQVRAERAVTWIDPPSAGNATTSRVRIFAEGNVRDMAAGGAPVPSLILDWSSAGDLRLRSQRKPIAEQSLADSDLYRKAVMAFEEVGTQIVAASAQIGELPPPREPELLLPENSPLDPPPGGFNERPILPANPDFNGPPSGQPAPDLFMPPLPPVAGGPGQVPLPMPGPGLTRQVEFRSRYPTGFQVQYRNLGPGQQAAIVTGGVAVNVFVVETGEALDVEADRAVIWIRGAEVQDLFSQGAIGAGPQPEREIELFLEGNVEVRARAGRAPGSPPPAPGAGQFEPKVIRADRVYIDVNANRAIAVQAEIEIAQAHIPETARFRADEIWQLSPREYRGINAEILSSRLPSDPGLTLFLSEATLIEERVPVRNFLFQPYRDDNGEILTEVERTFEGWNALLEVGDVPVFYFPFVRGDINDPLGPLEAVGFRQDQIFGTQILTTFDLLELLRIRKRPGLNGRWDIHADYLSDRGPAGGTTAELSGNEMLGIYTDYQSYLHAYGVYDEGFDQLGGVRSDQFVPPAGRGRVLFRHIQFLPYGFDFQGQFSYLSDKNFLEQYYKQEFDMGPNQETFAYLKWQDANWAGTILAQPNLRDWVNETQWLPRGDAYWLGQSFLDRLTYNAWASAGYADVQVTDLPPPPLLPTTAEVQTTRLNLSQELSVPFPLGPVKLAPYGRADLTYYSEDLAGNDRGRFYGGGGVRASLPLSRNYPCVESELLNLQGIHHKLTFGGNYYAAHSTIPFNELPQLDRLNDDATDQSVRDMQSRHVNELGPLVGNALAGPAPLFNPQVYAIRRLVDNRVDTLDSIQVLQLEARQRWQTKRGYPGLEHTIDWLTFDTSISFFPDSTRDNFDEPVSFLEYDSVWNVGDETALVSSGWFDPFDIGARYYTIGSYFSRAAIPGATDTYLYLGYSQIDPLESKAVTAQLTYRFSQKYALSVISTYDFGIREALTNQFVMTRSGTDLTLSFGISYQAIVENVGFTFEIIPNIVAATAGPRFINNSPTFNRRR